MQKRVSTIKPPPEHKINDKECAILLSNQEHAMESQSSTKKEATKHKEPEDSPMESSDNEADEDKPESSLKPKCEFKIEKVSNAPKKAVENNYHGTSLLHGIKAHKPRHNSAGDHTPELEGYGGYREYNSYQTVIDYVDDSIDFSDVSTQIPFGNHKSF